MSSTLEWKTLETAPATSEAVLEARLRSWSDAPTLRGNWSTGLLVRVGLVYHHDYYDDYYYYHYDHYALYDLLCSIVLLSVLSIIIIVILTERELEYRTPG